MTGLLARPARRRRRSASGRRAALRAGVAAVLVVAGVVAGAAGLLVQSTPELRDAQLLTVGQAWTAPERPPFVGDLVVYGTPAPGRRPTLQQLGCQVTEGGGPLSTAHAAGRTGWSSRAGASSRWCRSPGTPGTASDAPGRRHRSRPRCTWCPVRTSGTSSRWPGTASLPCSCL